MRCLVTGAAAGLGRALAEKLMAGGGHVAGIDRDAAELRELEAAHGELFVAVHADLADSNVLPGIVAAAASAGPFDLAILNAGISATGRFEDIPGGAYESLLAVNTTAPLVIASTLVREKHMAAGSTIVFVSSLSHATGYPGASVYAASKDAVAIYARSVRRPFRKRGVHVLTVFPGPIRTAHAERHAPEGADAKRRMAPEDLAGRIHDGVKRRRKTLHPGTAARFARIAGKAAPGAVTKLMRRIIFDKLDGPVH